MSQTQHDGASLRDAREESNTIKDPDEWATSG